MQKMKTRKKRLSRWTALLLSLLLLFSMMVPTGFAVENDSGDSSAVVTVDGEGDSAAPDSSAPIEENTGTDTSMTSDEAAPDSSAPDEEESGANGDATPDDPGDNEPDSSEPDQEDTADTAISSVVAAFGAFDAPTEYDYGTDWADIVASLPDELPVTLDDGTEAVIPVTWTSENEEGYKTAPVANHKLTFTAVVAGGYTLGDGASAPEIELNWSASGTAPVVDLQMTELDTKAQLFVGEYPIMTLNSEQGDQIYLYAPDEKIHYASWTTREYVATNGDGVSTHAFCVQPQAASPKSGYYTVYELTGETAEIMKAEMMTLYDGPYFEATKNALYDSASLSQGNDYLYALTHAHLAFAYEGTLVGISSSSLTDYRNIYNHFTSLVRGELNWVSPVYELIYNDLSNYKIYIAYTGSSQDIVWIEKITPKNGWIEINKSSANTAITNGNSCYSLDGAVYGVYSDSNCTNQVTTLTTDKNGYAKSGELTAGNYWIKELSASRGYMVDTAAHAVTVTAEQTATVNVTEQPANDPVGITLTKIAGNGVLNTSSLAGAQFTVKFYAGQYSSTSQLPSTPTRTWVIETKKIGSTYYTYLSDSYKVSGDNFYYLDGNPDPVLPLGTLTIQETKAAEDYTLNGGWLNTNSGASVSSNGGVILLNVTQDGITGGGYIRGGNYYTKIDHSLNPGQAVSKLASKTTGATFNAASGRYDGTKNPGIYDAYEQVVFTLTVSNTGDQTLFNVNLDDDISDFAAYVYNNTFGYTTADGSTALRVGDSLTTTKGNKAKITGISHRGNTYSITLDRLAVGDSVKLYASCILFSDDGDHYNLENTVHLTSQYDCTGGNSSTNKLKTTPDTIKNGDNHSWDRDWINLRAHGSVKLTKYGSDGKTPLEGVTFALLDADGKTVQEVTTGADGVALWENLPLRSYSIVETQTVTGATLLKDPITFTLPLQMTESEAASTGADTTGILKTGNTFYFFDLTYEVRNNPTLTLPRTGGSDHAVWIAGMAGCAAVLAAAAVFVSTTRRRKEK